MGVYRRLYPRLLSLVFWFMHSRTSNREIGPFRQTDARLKYGLSPHHVGRCPVYDLDTVHAVIDFSVHKPTALHRQYSYQTHSGGSYAFYQIRPTPG